ncbi:MAG: hypothetical protein AAGA50_31990, partial [Pseudomonadota bacterium]
AKKACPSSVFSNAASSSRQPVISSKSAIFLAPNSLSQYVHQMFQNYNSSKSQHLFKLLEMRLFPRHDGTQGAEATIFKNSPKQTAHPLLFAA